MVDYPKDWEEIYLGNYNEITSSKRVFEKEWETKGIPFLRTRDIASYHLKEEQKDKIYISRETYKCKVIASGEPQKGDLLVTGVGSIGLPFLIETDNKIYFKDGNIIWVKQSDSLFPKYLYYLFLSNLIKNQIINSSGFTTVGTFTIKNAKKIKILKPSIKEQKAIAETLMTFDRHLETLERLIQKKKMVRDGAVEDLMTGKTRLDGFDCDWLNCKLNSICNVYDGTHQTPHYVSQGIRFVSVEDINNIKGSNKYISESDFSRDFKIHPTLNDILMTRIGDIGTATLIKDDEKLAYYVSLALFKNIKINSNFLLQYIKSSNFKKELDKRILHHATPIKINKNDIGECFISYPKDIQEQKAIADILTSMDEEIENLEKEKVKVEKIKAGAMEDLLTGRIRLI